MPSADQVPVKSTHSTMLWPMWVVLIAGSTGSALRAVRPFQPSHHAGCPTRSLSRRECDGFLVALAPGHHCPSHSGHLVGKRDGSNLGGPPRQQRCKPRPMLGTVELRIADHGGMLPSLSLPPLEFCFGTSPIQAEKSRPDRNALGSATLATRAVASAGPTPGIASSLLLVSFDRCQAMMQRSNARI